MKKRTTKGKATAKPKPKGKKSMSKTDAIRAELKKNGSPSVVAKKLNAKGIKVSAQYVSSIKAADKRRALAGGQRRKPGRPVGSGKAAAMAIPNGELKDCLLYTSPSPRDKRQSRMPSSA